MKELDCKNMRNKILDLGYSPLEVDELIKNSINLDEDYNKLKNDYPIQYLIGYVDFYGYRIDVNENVLIPRYETEFLVEKTIKYVKKIFGDKRIDACDLATGSGAIAVALTKNINCNMTAIDISKKALEVAYKNFKYHNLDINILENNMLNSIEEKYDLIISNPPYISRKEKIMKMVSLYEPSIALYADNDGLYYYEEILKDIKKNLNKKFIIAFEIGCRQGEKIKNIIYKYLENINVYIEKDLSQRDRYIFIFSE